MFDPRARLVTRPERVANPFDDVVGCDADVRAALVKQLNDGAQHARHCAQRWIRLLKAADSVEGRVRKFQVNDRCLQMLRSGLKKILSVVVEFVAAHSISR